MKPTLVIATNNAHKLEEIEACIGEHFEIKTLFNLGFTGDIEETGLTLEENSLIKAQYIWDRYKVNCLADDSGLEVNTLNGQPGVHSARYAGEQRNHEDNMNLLLTNLKDKADRSANFRTVITLIVDGKANQFEGTVEGVIINEKIGNQGFGYDPIFLPNGYATTFAEMSLSEKNQLSHRSRALEKVMSFLK